MKKRRDILKIVIPAILIGIVIGLPVGARFSFLEKEIISLQDENTILQSQINLTKRAILETQVNITTLAETFNVTPYAIPPPKIIGVITPTESWALFKSYITSGGYDWEQGHEVTTKDEINRFLSALCADTTYQKIPLLRIREIMAFVYLLKWGDNRLIIGWVTPSANVDPFPVVIVKENDDYKVYKIIEGTLEPLEIMNRALIYVP